MAVLELDFVDDIPVQKRVVQPRQVKAAGAVKKPAKITETGDRYVAPDSKRAHGVYAKYVIEKCRCLPCTEANRAYELNRQRTMRRPDAAWVPYVPATRARRHLQHLRENGIGYKTVAAHTGVAPSTLGKILWPNRYRGMGTSRGIRPETERKILSVTVDMAAGGQKVPAGPTWVLLDDLIARGFYKTWIAEQLGQAKGSALQIKRTTVRASTARKVEQLHRRCARLDPPRRKSRWDR